MAGRMHWQIRNQPIFFGNVAFVTAMVFCLFAASTAYSADGNSRARWIKEGENQERRGNNVSAVNAYKRALQGDSTLDAEVFITLARLQRDMANFDDAIAWVERAQEAYEDDLESRSDLHASTLHELGWIYLRQGDIDRAAKPAGRALKIRLGQSPRNQRDVAASLNLKGVLLRQNTKYIEARAAFDQALVALADAPYHQDLAQVYTNLGGLDYFEAKYSDAVTRFRKAVEIQRQVLAAGHPDIGNTLNNLALMHQELGDLQQAASIYEEALAIKSAGYGEDHPRVGGTLHNMGIVASTLR